MTKIYEQHSAAFRKVEAFVIVKDGVRFATIAFKFPADGAGRLYAYVHCLGLEMVRGHAAGGGYDKRGAACARAVRGGQWLANAEHLAFKEALALDGCQSWDGALRKAGFVVWQAV